MNIRRICFAMSLLFGQTLLGTDFGYIYTETWNIGDDIQSVAAERFLPPGAVPIDRDMVSCFSSEKQVPTIMNGWFMWTKETWDREKVSLPDKSWPPTSSIDPLLVSIHFCPECFPKVFTEEGIQYLKDHGPVGARDTTTLRELENRGIPAYFSGCLTLTLERTAQERDDIIYAVDIPDAAIEYLRKHTTSKVEVIRHGYYVGPFYHSPQERLELAKMLLEKYQRAKCVVTSRLHCCLPCLAYETPVLFLTGGDGTRFDGLRDCYHQCELHKLLQGEVNYSFDNPPENPKRYLRLKNQLIRTVTKWVASKNS
jgi:hypothetical protein